MSTKDWRMPEPCGDCPFNASGPGLRLRQSLRPGRWRGILTGLLHGDTFPCHKTVEHDDDGEHIHSDGERVCAGAIAWQEAHGCSSQYVRVAERLHADRGRVSAMTREDYNRISEIVDGEAFAEPESAEERVWNMALKHAAGMILRAGHESGAPWAEHEPAPGSPQS